MWSQDQPDGTAIGFRMAPMAAHALCHAGDRTGDPMPRKPNYRFERSERERQKAAKKAARLAAKQERAEAAKAAAEGQPAEEPPAEPTED